MVRNCIDAWMLFVTCSASRRKWTQEELDFLMQQFGTLGRPPHFKEIRQAQRLMPCLKKRTQAQIKTRAWVLMSKQK